VGRCGGARADRDGFAGAVARRVEGVLVTTDVRATLSRVCLTDAGERVVGVGDVPGVVPPNSSASTISSSSSCTQSGRCTPRGCGTLQLREL